ncbi:yersiniabactin salicyl-AMP ligase [Clostridium sp. DSM 8431]|uniref:AMP-binding protein n=1 Tax=Clostridium sp. DSM 8431 TaxID=1761781 RepID=UPI0008E00DFF|nr:AMP-binding protein [Clostridium sp. DSM 8431]SFU41352.1 yersiniabactin salicyl-AMP ligase [Clostridium sp. DSM 8431]
MKSKNLKKYLSVEGFEEITFEKLLKKLSERYRNNVAIKDRSGIVTYDELIINSMKFAGKFEKLGLKNDNIVVLQCTNTKEFVEILFAFLIMGVVPVLVLPGYREKEIINIIKKTDALAYIAPEEYVGYKYNQIADVIKAECPSVKTILVDECFTNLDDEDGLSKNWCGKVSYDDVAVLLMSGGTTGEPKLIPRTHADYIYNARMSAKRSGFDESSVYLAASSIAHNMPLASPGILGTLCTGGTVILSYYLSPDEIMDLIDSEGVTITNFVPTTAKLCLELLETDDYNISTLKVVLIGGARVDEKLAIEVMDNFHCIFINQFGTAEGLILLTDPKDTRECCVRCQGKPISDADIIRIIDSNENDVEKGESGELVVKGPYTIESYYKEPTNESRFTKDGFYKTGDKAVITEDGNVCILGRIKEQINRAGEKILPSEIEDYLIQIEAVNKVVVVGIADNLLGERSCAFIELKNDFKIDEQKIHEEMLQRGIAQYKIPDQIMFIKEWPLTKMGKVDSNKLKEIASIK